MHTGDWIACFGREPSLSAWELYRVTGQDFGTLHKEVAVLPPMPGHSLVQLQQRCGGLVKVGEVLGIAPDLVSLHATLVQAWPQLVPAGSTARVHFGVSVYGAGGATLPQVRKEAKNLAQGLKRELVERGRSARLVIAKEPVLPAAALIQGKILERGFEILILTTPDGLVWGKTVAVQDISGYGNRDLGRPRRDATSGMLPPKLAQIMVNLTAPRPKATLLDPFCGSGTILQEAALLGLEHIVGADMSDKAVQDSTVNVQWLQEHSQVTKDINVFRADAGEITKHVQPNSIDVIATEPYLGPPQRGVPAGRVLLPLVSALSRQYEQWLQAMADVLQPGGRLAMVWPFFQVEKRGYFLQLQDAVKKAGLQVISPPAWMPEQAWFRSTPRGTVLYSRPDQVVGREIALLEKHA
ncbi:MAG: methyltransferase domain-containing protein [Patescibacteria group bacterium]